MSPTSAVRLVFVLAVQNRHVRKLLIFVFVLIVLVVGLDIGGRYYAESKASEKIGQQLGTAGPAVDIHGFSFLVQAIPGQYKNVTLSSSDLKAGPITGIAGTIELYDVNFPLRDAIKGDTSNLTAAHATVNGVIPDSEIAAAMNQPNVTISSGQNGSIRLSTSVSVFGQKIPITADMVVSYSAGTLHLHATGLTAAGLSLSALTNLTKGLSLSLPLKDLPFTLDAATLTASGSNLLLTATANDVHIEAPATT
jgi:hypothetical protein